MIGVRDGFGVGLTGVGGGGLVIGVLVGVTRGVDVLSGVGCPGTGVGNAELVPVTLFESTDVLELTVEFASKVFEFVFESKTGIVASGLGVA